MKKKSNSFQYQWQEADPPASLAHQSSSTSVGFWCLGIFLTLTLSIFVFQSYRNSAEEKQKQVKRELSSLQHVDIEPFLIRVSTKRGTAIRKIKTRFFVNNIQTKSELNQNQGQFKEYLIFMLSNTPIEILVSQEKKLLLQDEVRAYINSFLYKGQIQSIEIDTQLI